MGFGGGPTSLCFSLSLLRCHLRWSLRSVVVARTPSERSTPSYEEPPLHPTSESEAWISIDGKTPHLLPLSEAENKIRDDVPLVCGWALINAFSIVFGAASGYLADYIHVSCSQSSFILPCIELTDAEQARLIALFIGMLCCAPSQAAAAALALLLPRRRPWARRALAYLALAGTILFHCMYASTVWTLLAADPGYIFGRIYYTVIICFIVVCDLRCCVALLLEAMGGASSA